MNCRLLAVLLSGLATPAEAGASNWKYVTTNATSSDVYLDLDSIRRSGSKVTYWRKVDAKRDKSVTYRESREMWRDDCDATTATLLSYILYDATGKVTGSQTIRTYNQEEKPVAPETVGAAVQELICG